jgi:hypothetical protein
MSARYSLLLLVTCALAACAQSQTRPPSITGTIVDADGAVITTAAVTLDQPGYAPQKTPAAGDGTFTFYNLAPGPFQLTITAPGFATKTIPGELQPGQIDQLSQIQLEVAANLQVAVAETQEQIATEQVHVEEQQRVLGIFPNYWVIYDPNPAPLKTRQKYQLAWKASINPVSFGVAAVFAALEQSRNLYSGYGQGWQGYGKRLGAAEADSVAGTFIGGAILPGLFHQDPRYYYQGTGTTKSRLRHALLASVICKGDNGRWQPNYSSMLGDLAAGALSYTYYPASNRNGVSLFFGNAALGIAGSSVGAVFEEFLLRKFTSHTHGLSQQN